MILPPPLFRAGAFFRELPFPGAYFVVKTEFLSKVIYYFPSKILYLATLRIFFPSEVCAMKSIQQKLRGLREDNDLTQTQIAQVLGTSQTMYARYERGANELPIRHLITLCRFYNVSADFFLDTEPDQRRRKGIR